MKQAIESVDAVIIGGNLRGLVAAHVLNSLGFRAVLLERGPKLGGADGSFYTAQGNLFDVGLHVLDYNRSKLATRLLTEAVNAEVVKTVLRRAIVMRGELMPYAPQPAQMPQGLSRLLPDRPIVDEMGDAKPSRAALESFYGESYVNFVFDEVLPSFPSEHWHCQFGVDESELMTNIYPWFFPRTETLVASHDESRHFHDQLRRGTPQEVLYPREGGFAGFASGLAAGLDVQRIEVITGARVQVELESDHRIRWVEHDKRRFVARQYFWAAGWPNLCELLGLACQEVATDRVVLGSFRFDRAVDCDFHEVLVGDPDLHINRISLPGKFRQSEEALLQIEFAHPLKDTRWSTDPQVWRRRWLGDLATLGILNGAHQLEDFDFKSVSLHFNSYGMQGERLRDADPSDLHPDSNVRPVVPSMANLNINRYVPRAFAYVSQTMAGM